MSAAERASEARLRVYPSTHRGRHGRGSGAITDAISGDFYAEFQAKSAEEEDVATFVGGSDQRNLDLLLGTHSLSRLV